MLQPNWRFCSSVYLPDRHCTIFRDDELGIQRQVEVKRKGVQLASKERHYFFIDGIDTVFSNEAKMLHMLRSLRYRDARPLRRASIMHRLMAGLRLPGLSPVQSRRSG